MEPWLEPCLDAEEMRAIDRWAIDERGVPSLELMETAGRAVAEVAAAIATDKRAVVVCGKGNNGGDGLVAARALAETGFEAEALLLWPRDELSPDAQANLERHPQAREVDAGQLAEALAGAGVVIDAIFGTGFAGAPRDPATAAIGAINDCEAPVVATDIASGVNASTGEIEGVAVKAAATVTFHAPKLGHHVNPGKGNAGELTVAPIGIPEGGPAKESAGLIAPSVLELPPRRQSGSTKFTSGQVVVAGGSRGLTGAVCLAAEASIRAGAGYCTVAVPADLESIFEIKLTEVMSVGCAFREGGLRPAASEQILEACERAAAVVLGPGAGKRQGTERLLRDLAPRIEAPVLIDADGLNAHAGRLGDLARREGDLILTPHEGELARLLEIDSDEVKAQRLKRAREAAEIAEAVLVLKGDDTIVTDGKRVAVNRIQSPALATAGTGDVLSGLTAALLARGTEPFTAACAAVLAHGRAGQIAAAEHGVESVIAGDVIDAIPAALVPEL
jgi:NAD(P)H-hydrate epimerase